MSKFFQALERAKRERMLEERARKEETVKGGPETGSMPVFLKKEPDPAPEAAPSASRPEGADVPRGIDDHLVSLLAPTSFEAEQYRTLRYVVEHIRKECDLQVLGVTSPAVGDGKTVTAINLAGSFAQAPDVRVLLLDADLRQPSVKEQLGLAGSGKSGLVEVIMDSSLSLRDAVIHHDPFNLSVLPVSGPPSAPYEVLRSERIAEIMEEARKSYDYIVLDMPPLISIPDCRVLSKWIDGFLVVVAANRTPRKLVEEALNIVDPAKMVGLVFNSDEHPIAGYNGYYYVDRSTNGGGASWSGRGTKTRAALTGGMSTAGLMRG